MTGQLAAASTMANPLTQELIDHIESNEVSIYMATCDTQRTLRGTRAYACRMAADGPSITTWIKVEGNDAVLANIKNSGRLALVICNVESNKALQLKAIDARITDIRSDDYPRLLTYQQGFIAKTSSLGYPADVMRTHIHFRVDALVAVQFTPIAAFTQTPGPKAGTQVGAA
ncbi:MAG: hypothetical protein QM808_07415 [Steroidobacteraceae bacterium]